MGVGKEHSLDAAAVGGGGDEDMYDEGVRGNKDRGVSTAQHLPLNARAGV
jgi:hypothetical protein